MVYVIILEVFALRMIDARKLWTTGREAMAMVGAILIIIFSSTALTNFMVTADVPAKLVHWTQDHVDSRILFLLAINVILLIVGTVMDIFSAIVVVLPLIAPIAKAYGIDQRTTSASSSCSTWRSGICTHRSASTCSSPASSSSARSPR